MIFNLCKPSKFSENVNKFIVILTFSVENLNFIDTLFRKYFVCCDSDNDVIIYCNGPIIKLKHFSMLSVTHEFPYTMRILIA